MRRLAPAAALGVTIAAVVVCYSTAFWPVLASRALVAKAADEELSENERVDTLLEATNADPFSADAWVALARLSLEHLKQNPKSEEWSQRFLTANGAIVALRGHSSAAWREIANWYREVYRVDPNAELADRLVQLTRGAAFLYPNSAVLQAEYALALDVAGNTAAAKRTAAKAMELDGRMPHADKKLSPALTSQLEKLLDATEQPGPSLDGPEVVK